jgi:hypothetical protein
MTMQSSDKLTAFVVFLLILAGLCILAVVYEDCQKRDDKIMDCIKTGGHPAECHDIFKRSGT